MNDKILYKDSVSLLSFESLYCIGGYVTFEILVSTSGFAGNCNFCIGEKTIQDYTNCLDTMISLLDGEVKCTLCQGHYDFFLFRFLFYICLLCRGIKVMPLIDCFHLLL